MSDHQLSGLRRKGLNECDAIEHATQVYRANWRPEISLQTRTALIIDAYLDYFGLSREDICPNAMNAYVPANPPQETRT